MKIFLRNLMLFAFMLIPVHGQSAASPSPASAAKQSSESVVPAADPVPSTPAPEIRDADMEFPVLRTIGGMGLVVFLMVAVFFAARKFAPRYFSKPVLQRNLKLVETLAMGDRRSISLVEVGNSRFLVGNTPHQINLLAALPEPVSLVSEPEGVATTQKGSNKKGSGAPFRNLFEVEKGRPTQQAGHPLPEDLRVKMRQLRDALERS